MITLTKATRLTRLALKGLVILFIVWIVLSIFIRVGTSLKNKFFPSPLPAPTVEFGELPLPVFPKSVTETSLSYSVDTVSGDLPTFLQQVNVYKTLEARPFFFSLQSARVKVGNLGFKTGETKISTNVYRWRDEENGRTIIFDIITNDFDMTSNFLDDPDILAARNLANPDESKNIVKNFLDQLGVYPNDIDLEKSKVRLFVVQNGELQEASSLSSAQIVRVDLFQKDINDKQIIYPQKNASLSYFLIGARRNGPQVVEAHFFKRDIDVSHPSTYPLISSIQAFEILKDGKAYITSAPEETSEVAIRQVSLAYYFSKETSNFLYPVFVFEGSNDFTALVSALSQ